MIGAPLLSGLIGVWQNYLVTVMAQGVMFDLRNEMYGKLLRQSLRFFTNTKSGEILSRIQNDVGGVQGVVSGTLVSLATNALDGRCRRWSSSSAWTGGSRWSPSASCRSSSCRRAASVRSARRLSKETQERLAELTSYIQETLSVSGYPADAAVRRAGLRARSAFADKAGAVRDLQIQQSMARPLVLHVAA